MSDRAQSATSSAALRRVAFDLVDRELQIAGQLRRNGQGAPELAGLVRAARGIKMPVTQMSAAAGLTRPTVYDLEGGKQPTVFDSETERVAVLCCLAVCRFDNAIGIGSLLRLPSERALATLSVLARDGQTFPAAVGSLTTDSPFKILDAGVRALEERLESLRGRRVAGYHFYLEIPDENRPAIERAAAQLLKTDEHKLMGAHIAHAMRTPELALVIRADSDREAFTIVREIWEQVCRRADLELPLSIAVALPPKTKH